MAARNSWTMIGGLSLALLAAMGAAAAFETSVFPAQFVIGLCAGIALSVVFAVWLYGRSQVRLLAIVDPDALGLAARLSLLTRGLMPLPKLEERVRSALLRERQSGREFSRIVFALQLHHRLKNSLQILASLLTLQIARQESDECVTALRSTLLRLFVFGAVYRAAETENTDAVVDLVAIVEELVEHAKRVYRLPHNTIELDLDLGPSAISAETAIPWGLALAETLVVIGMARSEGSSPLPPAKIRLAFDAAQNRLVLRAEGKALLAFAGEAPEAWSISHTFLTSYATQLMGAVDVSTEDPIPSVTLTGALAHSRN